MCLVTLNKSVLQSMKQFSNFSKSLNIDFIISFVSFRPILPVVLDQNYINLKNQIIKAERRVLKELGFCVHVKHPHKVLDSSMKSKRFLCCYFNFNSSSSLSYKIIVMYLKWLELDANRELLQMSW